MYVLRKTFDTVGGRNPAPVDKYFTPLIIYKVLYIPGGAGFLPSTVFELFCFIPSDKMHAKKQLSSM